MVFDVLRGYLHVASGLSDVTKQRARDLAETIVVQGMDVTSKSQEQVQTLTDELVESSRTNRELLIGLIRTEVDRTVSRMGFVREDELAAVRQHVHRLETQIQKEHQRAADKATEVVMGTAGTSTSAARSAVGAASKTVSGVAGVVASGAAKMAGSASATASPVGTGDAGLKGSASTSAGSDSAAVSKPTTHTDVAADPGGDTAGKHEPKKATGKSQTVATSKARAAAKKTPAKKTRAGKPSASKSESAEESAPKMTTTKKATAKKAAPRKNTTGKKAGPRKKTATKKASETKKPKNAATKEPKPPKSKVANKKTRESAETGKPLSKQSGESSSKADS